MAAISPSPNSAPSDIQPPQPSTPPPSSLATPIEQPNANPPTPVSPPSPPPLDTSPPPIPSVAPTPTSPASPPPAPIVTQPSPSNASPPTPEVSPPPPTIDPPVVSPPPAQSPPPVPPPTPPPISPPPPPLATPPTSVPPPPLATPPTNVPPPPLATPPTSVPSPPLATPPTSVPPPPPPPPPPSSPPLVSPPTPSSSSPPNDPQTPPPSSSLPISPPPPPSSRPPESSPPPPPPPSPSSTPPENPPPPPSSNPPITSPPPPASRPPHGSPPSSSSGPPPSDSQPASPPSVTPVTPPVSRSPPSPDSQTTVPSPPMVPSNSSLVDAPQTALAAGSDGGIGTGGTAVIGVIAGVLILGLIGLVAFCIFKRKKRSFGSNGGHVIPTSIGSSPRSDAKLFVKTEYPPSLFGGSSSDTPTERGGYGYSRALFTYQELFEATSGFSEHNLLGEGGFGCVYKGFLPDGRVVAVKQLKVGASQGESQFKAEVEIISRIHHRHLVSLDGYCSSDSRRLLVYEYVANDTLHFHLHGKGSPVLDWATRVKIAAGAARGIAYLHEDCHPRVIHRDIKSSNILLDNNFEARVSDFGLAKLAMDADTHVSTRVMGTFGYLAPEYATSGKLTEKSDVYSFGVVLLELITGRRPVDGSQPLGDESLVEWARPLLTHALDTGELTELVDPQLENNYIESEMFRMIEAAAACVRHSASKRPRMGQIVRAFDGISDSGDLSNGLRVGESQLYDSAQQSADIRWFRRMAFGSQNISTDFFSQPTQNLGFSSQRGQGGNVSRQQSQDAQNLGNLVQNVSADHGQSSNFTRQESRESENPGFSGQSRQNAYSSAQQNFDSHMSR